MLEIMNTPIINGFKEGAPVKFIAHLDGTPETALPGMTTIPNINSIGLYAGAKYVAKPKAFGTSSATAPGGNACIFVNTPDATFNKLKKEFAIQCYLGRTGIGLNLGDTGAVNYIYCDRHPHTAPILPPESYPRVITIEVFMDNKGILKFSFRNTNGTLLYSEKSTGIDLFSQLSTEVSKHFLVQVKNEMLEFYLAGSLLYTTPVPGFNGSQYAGQWTFLNNFLLGIPSTRLTIDEICINDSWVTDGTYIPPTKPFTL